jgi:hypothetical protein
VPSRADDAESAEQNLLWILMQNGSELIVDGLDRRGRDPEIEDTRLKVLDEDEAAEITVARDEDAFLVTSHKQQLCVGGFRATALGCSH